jgi:hypothetical protein
MICSFKNGAHISFYVAKVISQVEYKEYLKWLGLEKFTEIKFDIGPTKESQKVSLYQFAPKIKEISSLD